MWSTTETFKYSTAKSLLDMKNNMNRAEWAQLMREWLPVPEGSTMKDRARQVEALGLEVRLGGRAHSFVRNNPEANTSCQLLQDGKEHYVGRLKSDGSLVVEIVPDSPEDRTFYIYKVPKQPRYS